MKPKHFLLGTVHYALSTLVAPRLALANELPQPVALANDEGLGSFDAQAPDTIFIPYGEYPHGQVTQIFNEESAKTMASIQKGGMRNWLKTIMKVGWHRVSGQDLPFFKGHPDVPNSRDTDKQAYGWITGITGLANGAEFAVTWTDEGRKLVASRAFRFFSPYWEVLPVKGGNGKVMPVIMRSFGMTNTPNIAVKALANDAVRDDEDALPEGLELEALDNAAADPAAEAKKDGEDPAAEAAEDPPQDKPGEAQEAPAETDLCKIAKVLSLPDNATLAEIMAAADALVTKVNGYEAMQAEAVKKAVETMEADKAALTAKANEATTEAQRLQALCNEHAEAHATGLVDGLIKAGILVAADRTPEIGKLTGLANAAAVTAAYATLAAGPVKLKTTQGPTAGVEADAKTMSLANETPEGIRRNELRSLVADIKKRLDPDNKQPANLHERAYREARNVRPDLFERGDA